MGKFLRKAHTKKQNVRDVEYFLSCNKLNFYRYVGTIIKLLKYGKVDK